MKNNSEFSPVQSEFLAIARHIYSQEGEKFSIAKVISEWKGIASKPVPVYEWNEPEGRLRMLLHGDRDNKYKNFTTAKFEVLDADGGVSITVESNPHRQALENDPFNHFVLTAFKSYVEGHRLQPID